MMNESKWFTEKKTYTSVKYVDESVRTNEWEAVMIEHKGPYNTNVGSQHRLLKHTLIQNS